MAVVQKCVILLLIALALSDVTRAQSWREYLQYRRDMELQRKQAEQEPPQEPAVPQGGKLRSYLEQLRLEQEMRERQAEIDQAQMEEMGELIKDYNMEEFSQQLGVDSLSRILRPLREYPTTSPIADCVERELHVQFDFEIAGTIKYEVCGTGDSSSLKLRLLLAGDTTPAMETTTPIQTTTAAETTPAPLCPHHAEEEQEETTTTTATTPEEPETTAAEETTAAA